MADDLLDRYNELKKQEAKLQREHDRAEGAREQYLKRLQEEFNCGTVEAAEKLLKKLGKEEQELKAEFGRGLAEFEGEYDNGE